MRPWKRIEPTIVTKIDYRHVVVKTFEVPVTKKIITIATFLQEGLEFAGVIALTKDKKVIVARQFRHGPEKIMDEIPGGGVDAGENPEAAARRELLEETGYVVGAIEYLGVTSREGYTNGKWHYFLATDCELSASGPTSHEESEIIEIRTISIAEFLNVAKHDGMTDPAAVLLAYDQLLELNS